jgi:hypothetical protein
VVDENPNLRYADRLKRRRERDRDRLERRVLRLLHLEYLARADQASTTPEDVLAVSAEVQEAMAAWRLAVGR